MDIQEFLADRNISYEAVPHAPAERAHDVALAIEASPASVAKTVLLKADSGYAYVAAVIPADREVDLEKASQALLGAKMELASADETAIQCPDYDGAVISPFGSQYNLKTLVDQRLANEEFVHFASNSMGEAVRVRFEDYLRTENPIVAPLVRQQ